MQMGDAICIIYIMTATLIPAITVTLACASYVDNDQVRGIVWRYQDSHIVNYQECQVAMKRFAMTDKVAGHRIDDTDVDQYQCLLNE